MACASRAETGAATRPRTAGAELPVDSALELVSGNRDRHVSGTAGATGTRRQPEAKGAPTAGDRQRVSVPHSFGRRYLDRFCTGGRAGGKDIGDREEDHRRAAATAGVADTVGRAA